MLEVFFALKNLFRGLSARNSPHRWGHTGLSFVEDELTLQCTCRPVRLCVAQCLFHLTHKDIRSLGVRGPPITHLIVCDNLRLSQRETQYGSKLQRHKTFGNGSEENPDSIINFPLTLILPNRKIKPKFMITSKFRGPDSNLCVPGVF